MIYDQGKYKELYKSTQRVNPLEFPGYDEKLEFLQQKTGLNEAVVVASGKINGTKVITCVMDSRFLMGSMSSIVGEKSRKLLNMQPKESIHSLFFHLLQQQLHLNLFFVVEILIFHRIHSLFLQLQEALECKKEFIL